MQEYQQAKEIHKRKENLEIKNFQLQVVISLNKYDIAKTSVWIRNLQKGVSHIDYKNVDL